MLAKEIGDIVQCDDCMTHHNRHCVIIEDFLAAGAKDFLLNFVNDDDDFCVQIEVNKNENQY